MSIIDGVFVIGIILVTIFQVRFIVALKSEDQALWEKAGSPTIFNPGSVFGTAIFVLFKEYEKSTSKRVVSSGNVYRYTFFAMLAVAIIYFVLPMEFWHG